MLAEFKEWTSRAELRRHLDQHVDLSVLVGEAAESARRFYSCGLETAVGTVEMGVVMSDLGCRPAAIELERGHVVVVGHDAQLSWVDIASRKISRERRLDGAFFEFLAVGDDDFVVVHELGAARFDSRGVEAWSVDTDVIEAYSVDSLGNLVLSVMDHPHPVVVSIESGRR